MASAHDDEMQELRDENARLRSSQSYEFAPERLEEAIEDDIEKLRRIGRHNATKESNDE